MARADANGHPVKLADRVARAGFTVAHNVVLFDKTLSPQARLLYFQLRHYGYLGHEPDQARMAANLGIKERAMRPYVRELEEAGLLETHRRGRGLTNEYVVREPDRQNTAGLDRQETADQTGSELPLSRARAGSGEERNTAPSNEGARTARSDSERAAVYNALVVAFFPEGGEAVLTKREAQKVGIASGEILKVGGTPEDVAVRAARLPKVLPPGSTLTPLGLVGNWGLCAAPAASLDPGCPYCKMRGGQHSSECEAVRPDSQDAAA